MKLFKEEHYLGRKPEDEESVDPPSDPDGGGGRA